MQSTEAQPKSGHEESKANGREHHLRDVGSNGAAASNGAGSNGAGTSGASSVNVILAANRNRGPFSVHGFDGNVRDLCLGELNFLAISGRGNANLHCD